MLCLWLEMLKMSLMHYDNVRSYALLHMLSALIVMSCIQRPGKISCEFVPKYACIKVVNENFKYIWLGSHCEIEHAKLMLENLICHMKQWSSAVLQDHIGQGEVYSIICVLFIYY